MRLPESLGCILRVRRIAGKLPLRLHEIYVLNFIYMKRGRTARGRY
jgi:hypothetical protein